VHEERDVKVYEEFTSTSLIACYAISSLTCQALLLVFSFVHTRMIGQRVARPIKKIPQELVSMIVSAEAELADASGAI
jgi:uncharacterized membrane protein YciS (DUF1049 family)